jgi:nucleotide-binding universal stress UspA family protein
MGFKTILVHVDLSRHAPARIRSAASLARAHGAQLVGAAMTGIPRALFPNGYDARPGTLCASHFDPLVRNARHALAQFEAIAVGMQVPREARLVCDQADDGLAMLARFADLVVASQDDPTESMTDMAAQIPDYVIMNSARPVLVLPRSDPPPVAHPAVLLGWDGGKEAACAAAAAIPILRQAASVTVLTLTGSGVEQDESLLGQDDVCAWLARHGVQAATLTRKAAGRTGRALLDIAAERGSELLVMGCYRHPRWRQRCLGGTSRTVLAQAGIPVLLAH